MDRLSVAICKAVQITSSLSANATIMLLERHLGNILWRHPLWIHHREQAHVMPVILCMDCLDLVCVVKAQILVVVVIVGVDSRTHL